MTKLALLAVALAFPSADTLDARGNVDDIHSLTADDTEQRVLVMQGYFESMWGKFNLGDCKCSDGKGSTNDCPDLTQRHVSNCNAFGVMQTWGPAQWVDGATPERVIANRRLGYEVGLAIFRWSMKRCDGKVRGALGLMFTGKACGYAADKVAKRCKWGGC